MKKLSVLLLVLFSLSNENYACTCEFYDGESIKIIAKKSDEIILGKKKTVSDSSFYQEFIFEVSKKWKGSKDKFIKIRHYPICGDFNPGEKEWIILTNKDSKGNYTTNGCSPIYTKGRGEIFKEIETSLDELFLNTKLKVDTQEFSKTDEQSYPQRFLIIVFITTTLILGFVFGKIKSRRSKKDKK